MSILHRLLSASYFPLRISNAFLRFANFKSDKRLRVLLYHDIAPQEQDHFGAQLRWLSKKWNFVSPERFEAMISGYEPIRGSNLLLTFDDGFASNRKIAEEILNPMGIKALFFVIADFVDLDDKEMQREFIGQFIIPGLKVSEMPAHFYNMSWNDLSFLQDSGHTIGAHTGTHVRLSTIENRDELAKEIVSSADKIESELGTKINHFAYTFGDVESFSPTSLEIARERFDYIHTGLRGDNAHGISSWAIRRDAVTSTDSLGLVGACLEGGVDVLYSGSFKKYLSWGSLNRLNQ